MDSSKRILNQLEHGRSEPPPPASRPPRKQLVYAAGIALCVAALAAAITEWGTDVALHPALHPALKPAPPPPIVKSEEEAQQLAAAIVNEPLQKHVAASAPGAALSAAASMAAHATTPSARAHAAKPPVQSPALPIKPSERDSDVALLAALMAHANGLDAADGQQSTATLLRRCARLAGEEAALCHARTCAGRWTYDSACRVTGSE
ncbi:hypothetical protein [Pseudoduganella sp. RAF53_2]|uniref:hypothetical protein n=1 Tax=unclassified Pseudoduganella TaxID=2637179 RepID=UPI003F9E0EB0